LHQEISWNHGIGSAAQVVLVGGIIAVMRLPPRFQQWLKDWAHFPWKSTARTLRARFREDHLGLTASSLTFTTIIALVPFLTVALAVFTTFPMFAKLQDVLQQWLVESLIPDNISRQVLGYLTQFSGKASKLGVLGLAFLLGTALALVFTIDSTLNGIWRVRRSRSLGQRVLIYWATITLGPLLLGASLSLTSYVLSLPPGLTGGAMPGGVRLFLDLLEFVVLAGGMTSLYHYMPNIHVKWGHAWTGGLFAAVGIEVAKKLLTIYISVVPTYSAVYGAFATVPILLIWIYVAWVIVLLGAVIAAYLPSLLAGVARHASAHGWQFQLALETLQTLNRVRDSATRGLTLTQLSGALQVDSLQLEPVLENLTALDWVGPLDEPNGARYVLLADPDTTALAPLMQLLLLERVEDTQNLWENGRWASLRLRDAL
jgi:membrane protein